MDSNLTMHSFTDLNPYNPPLDLIFGGLRSTTEFTKMEILGDGSSSSVYKAKDNKKNKIIAMKYLKRTGKVSVLPKEVLREITILKSLNHDNIIKFHSVIIGSDVDNLCLILDYCPHSLDKYIDCYPREIPHPQIKCIAKQMFKGLNYLHRNYIIHRDLKTPNLMISVDGVLKIIDFGLSRRFSHQNKAMTPEIITRWYQPPEILLQAPTYGPEVDMWSAGCILAELFKKKPFLPGESELQQICLIIDLIGTPTPNIWPDFAKCKVPKRISLKSQPFNRLQERFYDLGCTDALEILSKLFVYNPSERLSAEECIEHDWFEKAPYPAKLIEVPSELQLDQARMPKMITSG